MAAVPINFSRYFPVQPPAGAGQCEAVRGWQDNGFVWCFVSVLISQQAAGGCKKYPDQYSVELETKVHEVFTIMEKVLTGALPKVCRDAKLVRQRM